MEEKLAIDGKIIGTTADHVEYSKEGWSKATNAKTAIDDLHERLSDVEQNGGGSPYDDEIDNADLAMLADELLESGAIYSGWWDYVGLNVGSGANPVYDDCKTRDYYIQPPQRNAQRFIGSCAYFRVYEGDTVYYQNCGTPYHYAIILTDLNGKVMDVAPRGIGVNGQTGYGSNLDGIPVTENGYVICRKENSLGASLWVVSGRKTLKNKKKVYMAYGDSISSDDGNADNGSAFLGSRRICYPRVAAMLLDADWGRCSGAGWNFNMILGNSDKCRADADIVSILMGANDATQIGRGDVAATLGISGDVGNGVYSYAIPNAYMAKLISDGGLIIEGAYVALTGITVNGVSKYTNAEGDNLSSGSFKTIEKNVDFGTLSSGDVIAFQVAGDTVPSGGTQSFKVYTRYHVGSVSDVVAISDVESYIKELYTTYIGRYWLFLNRLLSVLKKPNVRIFCISLLNNLDAANTERGQLRENMRKGLFNLVASINDERVVWVNGGELIINKTNSDLWFDDLHPNENGQVVIANTLATIIKENLALIE